MPVQTNQTTETDKAKAKAAVDRIPTDWVRPDDAYLAIEPLVQAWTRLLRSEAWAQAEAVMEIGKLIFGEEDFMEEVVEKIKASP